MYEALRTWMRSYFFPPTCQSSVKQAAAYTAMYASSYCYICVLIHLDVALYEFFAESAVKQQPCCARVSRGHTHTNTFSCQSRVYTIIKLVTQVYLPTYSVPPCRHRQQPYQPLRENIERKALEIHASRIYLERDTRSSMGDALISVLVYI